MKAIARQAAYMHQSPALLAGLLNIEEQRFNDKAIAAMESSIKHLWGKLRPKLKEGSNAGTFKLVGVFLVHAWKQGYLAHERELLDTQNEQQGDGKGGGKCHGPSQKGKTRRPATGRRQPVPATVPGMQGRPAARAAGRKNAGAGSQG